MTSTVYNYLNALLGEASAPSWHEDERKSLGIPEDCAGEALLCVTLQPDNSDEPPMAFVVEPRQLENALTALSECLREAFHPLAGGEQALAIIDFLPPLDDFGAPQGLSRRWVVDNLTLGLVLPDLRRTLRVLTKGM